MGRLSYRVNEIPSWTSVLFYGFQQAMICVPGLVLTPQLISEAVCAGSAAAILKTQLMSATFVAAGVATVLQSILGLRLPIMHGPAAAFLPPILAYQIKQHCNLGEDEFVPEGEWQLRLREIAGSLMFACLIFVFIGFTGLAGVLSRLIGPITIVPVMILLCMSLLPLVQDMISSHWISALAMLMVVIMVVYLEDYPVYIPGYGKFCLFGQYPLALSITTCWLICCLITWFDLEPKSSPVRYDRNESLRIMNQSTWISLPYPGNIGLPTVNIGLGLAFVASVLVDVVENLGSYDLLARVCHQQRPPKNAVNRAIVVEGLGSMLGASMGVGLGLTTYSNNIAIIQMTKVASRAPMQCAGLMLIFLGVCTKAAAVMATIPDAIVGGTMIVVVGLIAGVSLSNLQLVDLSLSRNLSIMGFSLMAGIAIPLHFEKHPLRTGHQGLDEVLNMLLSIKMLVGGILAVFLDNTVRGASLEQRGLQQTLTLDLEHLDDSGYAFPSCVIRIVSKIPVIRSLPFMPPMDLQESNRTSITVNSLICAEKI